MKRIYMYLVAAMTIASAASCTEQISDTKRPAELGTMTISASMGTVSKTVYDNQSVLWEGDEQITVFSMGETVVDEAFEMSDCSQDKTKAQFTGIADLAADRYLAVYPHSAENSCTPEGTVSVSIPAVQTAVAGGFASGANVAVATFAKGDASVLFNNISTLISFGFETDDDAAKTKSVTIKVKKNDTDYYGIAGKVSVSYSDGEPVVSEGTEETVVVNAPEGGFVKGVTYYVPVAPVGAISGMELAYTDGTTTCTRRNDTDATFTRNSLFALGQIPIAYELPEEDFSVIFDFTQKWPFNEACKPIGDQVEDTEDKYSYTYEYAYEGMSLSRNLETGLLWGTYSGDLGYEYVEAETSYLLIKTGPDNKNNKTNNGTTYLRIPAMEGRYLKSVAVTNIGMRTDLLATTAQPILILTKETTSLSGNIKVDLNTEYIFTFPVNDNDSEIGVSYSIRSRCANLMISKVVATYSKTKPE